MSLALLVAACGGSASSSTSPGARAQARHLHELFPGLRVRYGGVARLIRAAPPASAALPGANDLLTASGAVLAATDLGIFRSADSGVTWRPVLTGVVAWSLTAAASGGYAAIGNLPGKPNVGPAVLATSADGVHWHVRKVTAPRQVIPFGGGYRIAMSGIGPHATGIAVSDTTWAFFSSPALRSTDGGLTWTRIGRTLPPGGFNGATFTDGGRVAFVTAPGGGSAGSQHCAGAVYRSTDAGATWSLMPTSCQPYPLTALQFVSASQGLAAGGLGYKAGGALVVESTSDGGSTWHTLVRKAGTPGGRPTYVGIVRLDMVSAQDGWAIEGGCEGGQNGPCDGAVFSTTDGGAGWSPTSQAANSLAGLDAAGQVALAGDDRSTVLASTTDAGRHWTERTPPRWVSTSAFSGAGSTQVWATNLGDFLSADAGSTWTSADQLRTAPFRYEIWLAGAPGRLLGNNQSMDVASSANGGQTFTTSRVPDANSGDSLLAAALGTSGRAIAVTGAGAQCVGPAQVKKIKKLKPGWKPPSGASTLFTSADGGAHWNGTGSVLPFGVQILSPAAADGSLVAIIDACDKLEVSTDSGSGWHAEAIAKTVFCTVSALARPGGSSGTGELWLTCQSGQGGFWVLHSADGGATWTAFWLPAAAAVNGMSVFGPGPSPVINPGGAFATKPGGAVMPAGGSLWRTTDGGRSWRQSWARL
jgi:photosystem II stability/assembly factor-like uncharacterized protein